MPQNGPYEPQVSEVVTMRGRQWVPRTELHRAHLLLMKGEAENEQLRDLLIRARNWIDHAGDFMARPMDLLADIDTAAAGSKTPPDPAD